MIVCDNKLLIIYIQTFSWNQTKEMSLKAYQSTDI